MPFQDALSAPELEKLRGSATIEPNYAAATYVSLCPNTVVYSAQIDQADFTDPTVEVEYDAGAGVLGDVRVGMVVLVASTDDPDAAHFRGRVRAAPGATTIYINEVSGQGFSDDDYVWIIDDYEVREKLPRYAGGTILVDWDTIFRRLLPMIYDLRSAYAGFVDTGTAILTLSFAPTVEAADNDAIGANTYLWDVGDGIITVGVATDKDITATFPAGFRWVHFTATDSNGNALTRHVPVWAHDTSTYPPDVMALDQISVSATIADGYQMELPAFDDVAGILDATLICAWSVEYYNGVLTSIEHNINFIGRWRSETSRTDYLETGQKDARVTFICEGVVAQLQRHRIDALEISESAAPDEFNEVEHLTPWRALWLLFTEYSTVAELHSVVFDDAGDTYRYPALVTQGGSLYDTVADLAQSYNAVLQMSAAGQIEVVRQAVILEEDADRNALVTVFQIGTTDFSAIELGRDYVNVTGALTGDGGGYNSTTGEVSAYNVSAPAGSPEMAPATTALPRQILIANQAAADETAELCARAGNVYALSQGPPRLTVTLMPGFHFLIPAADQWYTFSLDATQFVRGIEFDSNTRWYLNTIDVLHNNDIGTKGITAVFAQETWGAPGEIIYVPTTDYGEYPITPGDFDPGDIIGLPTITEGEIADDFTLDGWGWVPIAGGYDAAGWRAGCYVTYELLDISKYLGEVFTLTQIVVTYDATYGGGADLENKIYTRVGNGLWQLWDAFTTETGIGRTRIVYLPNVAADQIRVAMWAGGNDCSGSLVVTDISWTVLGDFWDEIIRFDEASDQDWTPVDIGGLPQAIWESGFGWRAIIAGEQRKRAWIESPEWEDIYISVLYYHCSVVPQTGYLCRMPNYDDYSLFNESGSPDEKTPRFAPGIMTPQMMIGPYRVEPGGYTGYLEWVRIIAAGPNPFA